MFRVVATPGVEAYKPPNHKACKLEDVDAHSVIFPWMNYQRDSLIEVLGITDWLHAISKV